MSKLFSANEQTTLEKYFIKLKIEKVKELIQLKQLSFSDANKIVDAFLLYIKKLSCKKIKLTFPPKCYYANMSDYIEFCLFSELSINIF